MTPENKERISRGLEVAWLVIWTFITIAACAGIWNAKLGTGMAVLAGVLMAANAFGIVRKALSIKAPKIEDWHLENPVEAAKKKKK